MQITLWSIQLHEFRYTEPAALPVTSESRKKALDFEYAITTSTETLPELLWLEVSILARNSYDKSEAAFIRISTVYQIPGVDVWLKKAQRNVSSERSLLTRLAQEALAHARAELRNRGAGTILDEAIFPLVNPLEEGL